jgi:hypothetical protein
MNIEELKAAVLADVERIFPEYGFVPAKRLNLVSGPTSG